MTLTSIARSFAIVSTALLFAWPASAGEPRAVVELFTSQGCSSCPPADRLLGELAKDSSLVALTMPVDYWDYLGWKDTLATPGHSARQRGYSRERGDRQVYTPQAVVNGAVHALGSSKAAIERAVAATRQDADTLSLPVTITKGDGKLTVQVPAWKGSGKGEVWLCPVTKAVAVKIGRGENRGRTVTYHNVVRGWIKLGDWTGAAQTWSVPLKDVAAENIDSVAVLVQRGAAKSPGAMVGASIAALR